MRVNIIIPTYNRAEFLPTALDAALAQTHTNTVVTVIDDASTDESWSIINFYASKNPTLLGLRLRRNLGTAQAMNCGLVARNWDAVSFHDSDDTVSSMKVARQVEALSTPMVVNSGVDAKLYSFIGQQIEVAWNSCWKLENGVRRRSGNPVFGVAQLLPNFFYATAPNDGFFPTNSGLYRRCVFEKLGCFQDLPVMSDTEFQNRVLLYGCAVRYIDEPLYTYFIHSQSQTFGEAFHAGTQKRREIAASVYARISELAAHRFDQNYPHFKQDFRSNLAEEVADVANRRQLLWQEDLLANS